MASQVKKVVAGPLTALAAVPAGVKFAVDGNEVGALQVTEIPGMSQELVDKLVANSPMAVRLIVHALSQKIGDSYANASKAENPLAFAQEQIAGTIKQIKEGLWRVVSEGGVGRASLLARALARVTGKSVEEAQGVVDLNSDLDDDGKPSEAGKAWLKAMRADARLKNAMDEINKEDAKAKLEALEKKGKLAEDATGDKLDLATLF